MNFRRGCCIVHFQYTVVYIIISVNLYICYAPYCLITAIYRPHDNKEKHLFEVSYDQNILQSKLVFTMHINDCMFKFKAMDLETGRPHVSWNLFPSDIRTWFYLTTYVSVTTGNINVVGSFTFPCLDTHPNGS